MTCDLCRCWAGVERLVLDAFPRAWLAWLSLSVDGGGKAHRARDKVSRRDPRWTPKTRDPPRSSYQASCWEPGEGACTLQHPSSGSSDEDRGRGRLGTGVWASDPVGGQGLSESCERSNFGCH
ncbi:hypothetical protein LCI18_001845 [Fusarium solani-melongenae]|uniref:Uncharacterized protein n=1 Tax=Fusarium solani subsp. cucurbitae TaxID=2747967 RepID=A0ACD3YPT8_FUSSC|nr:hypothetical protein LCI18_001845 [Fusarium solani-melongenae]